MEPRRAPPAGFDRPAPRGRARRTRLPVEPDHQLADPAARIVGVARIGVGGRHLEVVRDAQSRAGRGFATGLKLMLSNRFSMSNRISTFVRPWIAKRLVAPTSNRKNHGARISRLRGAQSPGRSWTQAAEFAGAMYWPVGAPRVVEYPSTVVRARAERPPRVQDHVVRQHPDFREAGRRVRAVVELVHLLQVVSVMPTSCTLPKSCRTVCMRPTRVDAPAARRCCRGPCSCRCRTAGPGRTGASSPPGS